MSIQSISRGKVSMYDFPHQTSTPRFWQQNLLVSLPQFLRRHPPHGGSRPPLDRGGWRMIPATPSAITMIPVIKTEPDSSG